MNSLSNQQNKGPMLAPTPVSDHQYKGLVLYPKRGGSISSHGAFNPASVRLRDSSNRGDIQAADSLTGLHNARGPYVKDHSHKDPSFNEMSPENSTQAVTNDSPFSSEAEIHPSSGVSLHQSDNTMPSTTLPQNASFHQLAQHQGIHDWNNSVFDKRWLLQPEEIWNLAPRAESVITVSPERQALGLDAAHSADQMGLGTGRTRHSSIQDVHMQSLIPDVEEKKSEPRDVQVSSTRTETRLGENVGMLAASGKISASRKGNFTNQ